MFAILGFLFLVSSLVPSKSTFDHSWFFSLIRESWRISGDDLQRLFAWPIRHGARKADRTPLISGFPSPKRFGTCEDCPAYGAVMRRIRRKEIRGLEAMCDALGQRPLQSEPGETSSD